MKFEDSLRLYQSIAEGNFSEKALRACRISYRASSTTVP
jgi:hypothetical protein